MPAVKNSKIKKVLLVLFSFVLLFTSLLQPLVPNAHAQTWYNQGFTDWYKKVYDQNESPPNEIFGERYTAAQVQWIVFSLISQPINFLGSKTQDVTTCFFTFGISAKIECITKITEAVSEVLDVLKISTNPFSQNLKNQDNTNVLSLVFSDYESRPLSGIKYLSSTISKFTSIPVANAQGFGFGAVDGLQKYWQGFRNMAYALTVLVVIVFAFMIMFRVKLSPQLVISVQVALPKVITVLVLATFSYAIAGFVIDLSYVVGGLFASLMNLAGFATSFKDAWNFIVPTGGTNILGGFYIFFYMLGYTILFFIAAIVTLAGTLSGLSVFGTIASLLMILMSIWVLILMIVYTIKVPWMLIKNLISLFISIVVAPIQIVIGALVPTIGFGVWFKKIIAESLVFPLTGLFMFLAWKTLYASMAASLGQVTQIFGAQQQNLWAPPILGSSQDMAGILWLAVSFTFITLIPKSVDIMKMLIMGQKFEFGTAIGEAVGPLQWGQRQVMGSPIARTFQESAGLVGASRMLKSASESEFWGNLMNKTQKLTGVNTKNAGEIANAWDSKAKQKQKVE